VVDIFTGDVFQGKHPRSISISKQKWIVFHDLGNIVRSVLALFLIYRHDYVPFYFNLSHTFASSAVNQINRIQSRTRESVTGKYYQSKAKRSIKNLARQSSGDHQTKREKGRGEA
jgi:hypothetical protein